MIDSAKVAWVTRVLSIDVAGAGTDIDFAQLVDRLKIVREDAAMLGAVEELKDGLREAVEALRARTADAVSLVDDLEDRIAKLTSAKRVREATKEIGDAAVSKRAGVVGFAKLRLKLNAARNGRTLAAVNLRTACSELLKTKDFADDPRCSDPQTLAIVAAIGDRVPPIDPLAEAVEDALDKMVSASDPQTREKLAAQALGEIGSYRLAIDAEPLLTEMESSDAGRFPIHSLIASALDELAAALRPA